MNYLVSEQITTTELNGKICTNSFFLIPGAGTIELKSFHMAGNLTSKISQGPENLTKSNFKKFKYPGNAGGENVEVSN